MSNDAKKGPVQLQAKIDDDVADGTYVNFANIMHNKDELVIDFGRIVPGRNQFKILSRIIATPSTAKRIVNAMNSNLEQYEKKFGEITIEDKDQPKKVGF